jgi:hypothetical protein
MKRSRALWMSLAVVWGPLLAGASAGADLSGLTNQDAARGIRGALDRGAAAAVDRLGTPGGFQNDPKVKIPLPPALDQVAKAMRLLGRSREADALVEAMNRAAEQAMPAARELLVASVRSMSFQDAKKILTGGDGSVTAFFREKTAAPLAVKFLPIIKQETDKVGLAQKYDQLAGEGEKLGLLKGDDANIEEYVTHKALDGLYLGIAEEEHKIRENPAAAGSAIVAKVFGLLR